MMPVLRSYEQNRHGQLVFRPVLRFFCVSMLVGFPKKKKHHTSIANVYLCKLYLFPPGGFACDWLRSSAVGFFFDKLTMIRLISFRVSAIDYVIANFFDSTVGTNSYQFYYN